MRDIPPFGGNPGDDFADGDPQAGIEGSPVPAEFFNAVRDELINLITGAGIEPSQADLTQVLEAVQALIAAAIPSIADASVTERGLVELATESETDAGLDQERAVTPYSLGIRSRTFGVTGYMRLPGGLMLVWGRIGVGNNTPVVFPASFPNLCFGVLLTDERGASDDPYVHGYTNATITGFTFRSTRAVTPLQDASFYLALGY